MFVDSSALTAILSGDPQARSLLARLEASKPRYTSGPAIFDSAAQLARTLDTGPDVAFASLKALAEEAEIMIVPVTTGMIEGAVAALTRFGPGSGHAAALGLAECLSYACAKAYRVPLLSCDSRYALTDIRIG